MANPNPALLNLAVYDGVDHRVRSNTLPAVYVYQGVHPLRPPRGLDEDAEDVGNTYVLLIDMSEEGRADEVARNPDLEIPVGREKEMRDKYGNLRSQSSNSMLDAQIVDVTGLLALEPGDWVFARDQSGDGDAHKDILQVIVPRGRFVFIELCG